MIAKSIAHYVGFGTYVRYLQDVPPGTPIGDGTDTLVLSNLKTFFYYLKDLELQVTIRASTDLQNFLKLLSARKKEDRLSQEEAEKLGKSIKEIRKTLEAELRGFEAYTVTPKRLDVQKLLHNVPALLAPGVYSSLPEIARDDLAEAGKCIAFERPTAAAFHLLRGTEAVLREFYCLLVKQKRSELMWGPMIADLRKRRKAEPYHDLIEHMDHIRKSFRNPTQHPEKVYDIQEVQDLWSLCADAINRMGKPLRPERPW